MTIRHIRQKGFTLVEVVIAVAILSVIATVAYSTLSNLIESKVVVDQDREIVSAAGALLTRITKELQLATDVVSTPIAPPYNRGLSNPPAFLAESKRQNGGKPMDRITFYANEAGQYLSDPKSRNRGLVQISYRVEKDPENKNSNDDTLYLIRDEIAVPPTDQNNPYKDLMTFPLSKNLVALKFTFLQYTAGVARWSDSWGGNSNQTNLPSAIKITLTLRGKSGKEMTFSTTVKGLEL